jgi:hypothetical protein
MSGGPSNISGFCDIISVDEGLEGHNNRISEDHALFYFFFLLRA